MRQRGRARVILLATHGMSNKGIVMEMGGKAYPWVAGEVGWLSCVLPDSKRIFLAEDAHEIDGHNWEAGLFAR